MCCPLARDHARVAMQPGGGGGGGATFFCECRVMDHGGSWLGKKNLNLI